MPVPSRQTRPIRTSSAPETDEEVDATREQRKRRAQNRERAQQERRQRREQRRVLDYQHRTSEAERARRKDGR